MKFYRFFLISALLIVVLPTAGSARFARNCFDFFKNLAGDYREITRGAYPDNKFSAELNLMRNLQASFGRAIRLEWSDDGRGVISAFTASGRIIGQLQYRVRADVLQIEFTFTGVGFDNRGVGAMLLAGALERYPHIRRISASLTMDNQAAVANALANGLSCIEALGQTPIYRAALRSQFTKIINTDCTYGVILIEKANL